MTVHIVSPEFGGTTDRHPRAKARCGVRRPRRDLALTLESARHHGGQICGNCKRVWMSLAAALERKEGE